jgi:hypothetical protein
MQKPELFVSIIKKIHHKRQANNRPDLLAEHNNSKSALLSNTIQEPKIQLLSSSRNRGLKENQHETLPKERPQEQFLFPTRQETTDTGSLDTPHACACKLFTGFHPKSSLEDIPCCPSGSETSSYRQFFLLFLADSPSIKPAKTAQVNHVSGIKKIILSPKQQSFLDLQIAQMTAPH